MKAFKTFVFALVCAFISSIGVSQTIVINPYLQDASPSQMAIMWEVDNTGAGAVIWGDSPFGLDSIQTSTSIVGSGASRIHVAVLSPLQPNKKYYYKVEMNGGQTSNIYSFVTPADYAAESATQLVAMSDMQRDGSHPNKFNEIVEQGIVPIIFSELGSDISDLEGVLIPGDLVATGGNYSQWQNHFFNPSDSLFPYVPVYPVPGNHEYFGGGLPNFLKYFTLPTNGPGAIVEQCWYKDISNVRIIGLNSNSGSGDQNLQLDWLGEVLDSTCTTDHVDFVFAQLHHPYKSELWTPGENSFTGKVIDSLTSFSSQCNRPSIHFFGHTHAYSRGQSRDHKHLWINVATAGGAIDNWGEFPNADYEEFVKSQDDYGFVLIDVLAGIEPQLTIKRFSRGDQDTIINNLQTDELTIFVNKIPPLKPINAFPVGDTILPSCLNLKASQFFSIEDSLQASHWEIASGGDFTDSLVASSWYQNENWYNEINTQANDDLTDALFDPLPGNKHYQWRVRYRDQNLEWSPWSDPTSFYLSNNDALLSPNLILNEGAENGVISWTGDIESLFNGECGSVAPYLGSYNFAVGGVCQNESTVGLASQTIDLTDYSVEIETGMVSADYGGYLRDWGGSDVPEMYVEFYNGGDLIQTTPSISNATTTWTFVNNVILIPTGTTSSKVYLKGTRNAGTDNDSYFDELQFYVVTNVGCPECFGSSGVDFDRDGFCDDLDCNDSDAEIYPGAIELCDSLDNDCNGIVENGPVATWTGNGGNERWGDDMNWDQMMVPLQCQHVVINDSASVVIDAFFACNSIELESGSTLDVQSSGRLLVNSKINNTFDPADIQGTLIIDGKCFIE